MNKRIRFTDEFKQDAVAQIVERGYAVSEVAERLGISTKSVYTWKGQFAKSPRVRAGTSEQAAEMVILPKTKGMRKWNFLGKISEEILMKMTRHRLGDRHHVHQNPFSGM